MAMARMSWSDFCDASPTKTFERLQCYWVACCRCSRSSHVDDMRVEVVYDTIDDVRAELAARGITIEAVKQLLYLAPEKVE